MWRRREWWSLGVLMAMGALLAAACGPAAEPTATTAPAEPTATTAPAQPTATTAPGQPTATTAPGQPTATTAPAEPTATTVAVEETRLRPIPVLESPPPNPNAQYGGVFIQGIDIDATTFMNWRTTSGSDLIPSMPTTDTLFEFNAFEPGKGEQLLPSLAYDWWLDESGERWTFKLVDGVKFSDGVEFTCADVKFMIETIRDGRDARGSELAVSPRQAMFRRVTDVSCPDAYTVVVTSDGPLPALAPLLANGFFAVKPRHVFEGNLALGDDTPGPGVGAFVLEEYVRSEHLKYARNPNFWRDPYPYLEGIEISILPPTALTAAYRVGRVDAIRPWTSLPKGTREELYQRGFLIDYGLTVGHGFSGWHTNWLREPWGDPRFAQALRCAINNEKAIDLGSDGEGFEGPIFPLEGPPGGSPWGLTREEWNALGPCHGLTADTDMAQRQGIARQLLADMGFGPGNPAQPHIPVRTTDTSWESILDDLNAVGIEPTYDFGTFPAQIAKAFAGEFDVYGHGFATPRHDPDTWLYEHYYSTSDRNYGKYSNAEVDALIDQMSRTVDSTVRGQLIKDISRILLRENAKVVVSHSARIIDKPAWIHDFYHTEPINAQTGHKFQRVWIDLAKRQQLAAR